MHHSPRKKWELRAINASFVLLFLIATGLLQWLSREFPLQFDLTANSRHSLSEASQAAAKGLTAPLGVTAYASQRGQQRRTIGEFIARYQKYKADIRLEFIDPDATPEQARAAGIQYDGELVLEYGGARENLGPTQLNEEFFTNALTRLGHRGERWLVFLAGHGERSPDRQANFDLSLWATQLRARGFKVRALALAEHPQIPQNTATLVIAGARARLLPGEVQEIRNYLERGGNLLWLADPGPLHGLEPVAETLGWSSSRGHRRSGIAGAHRQSGGAGDGELRHAPDCAQFQQRHAVPARRRDCAQHAGRLGGIRGYRHARASLV